MVEEDDDCRIIFEKPARIKVEQDHDAPLSKFRKQAEYSSRDGSPVRMDSINQQYLVSISEEEEGLMIDEPDSPQQNELTTPLERLSVSVGILSKFVKKEKKANDIKGITKIIKKDKARKAYMDIYLLISNNERFRSFSQSTQGRIYAELCAASSHTVRKLIGLAEEKNVRKILDILCISVRKNGDRLSAADKATLLREDIFGRTPDIHNFSFAKLASEKGIQLKHVKNIGSSVALNSLGCAYDPVKGFIFTGADKIFTCSEAGEDSTVLASDLKAPSAVCTIIFGEAFAFLTNDGVHLFDLRSNACTLIWRASKCRGLGITSRGNLVFAQLGINGTAQLILFNPRSLKVLFSIGFPLGSGNAAPSFLQVRDNYVFITDLGQKKLHIFKATDARLSMEASHDLSPYTTFPSGIVVDDQHEMMIVAADEQKIWRFNASLRKSSKIKAEHFPYGAGIAYSRNGYLMVSCRKCHGSRLFKVSPIREDEM